MTLTDEKRPIGTTYTDKVTRRLYVTYIVRFLSIPKVVLGYVPKRVGQAK